MKKRLYLYICLMAVGSLCVFGLSGCGKKEKEEEQKTQTEQDSPDIVIEEEDESDGEKQESETQETADSKDSDEKSSGGTGHSVESGVATIYYADNSTGEITGKNIDVQDEYDIWAGLQSVGILADDCNLLSLSIDEDEKKIDLDFDSATGDRIRSMGTAGETEIIGCMINTYLEAYNCDWIKLTEEGEPVETSHGGSLDGYSGIASF